MLRLIFAMAGGLVAVHGDVDCGNGMQVANAGLVMDEKVYGIVGSWEKGCHNCGEYLHNKGTIPDSKWYCQRDFFNTGIWLKHDSTIDVETPGATPIIKDMKVHIPEGMKADIPAAEIKSGGEHAAADKKGDVHEVELKSQGDHGCPDVPPAACISNCQCLTCGPWPNRHFYKCGALWCDDQCQSCHTRVQPLVNSTGMKVDMLRLTMADTSANALAGWDDDAILHTQVKNGNLVDIPAAEIKSGGDHGAADKKGDVQEAELKSQGDHGCPGIPPAACSSNCQCLPCGPWPNCHFYKCGALWCNDQCQGCHTGAEPTENATGIKTDVKVMHIVEEVLI